LSYRKGIKEIGDDRGWGCMIRAVQMLIAEGMQRLCGLSSNWVLEYFQETEDAALSLVNICRAGHIGRSLVDSEKRWTSASEVLSICSRLLNKISRLDLKVINETSGCLLPENIAEVDSPTLLIIHNRLGIDQIEQLYLPHLKALMELHQFSGMLGGTPGQAMFLLGYHNDRAIMLDPHYVQV